MGGIAVGHSNQCGKQLSPLVTTTGYLWKSLDDALQNRQPDSILVPTRWAQPSFSSSPHRGPD